MPRIKDDNYSKSTMRYSEMNGGILQVVMGGALVWTAGALIGSGQNGRANIT